MKKIVLFIILILVGMSAIYSCKKDTQKNDEFKDLLSEKIGEFDKNNKPIITYDAETLLLKYNNYAIENDINTLFTKLRIQSFYNKGEKHYMLCAYNKDSTQRIATLLEKREDDLFFYNINKNNKAPRATMSCHTKDCANDTGCTPINSGLGWHCSSCSGDCTKITTIEL